MFKTTAAAPVKNSNPVWELNATPEKLEQIREGFVFNFFSHEWDEEYLQGKFKETLQDWKRNSVTINGKTCKVKPEDEFDLKPENFKQSFLAQLSKDERILDFVCYFTHQNGFMNITIPAVFAELVANGATSIGVACEDCSKPKCSFIGNQNGTVDYIEEIDIKGFHNRANVEQPEDILKEHNISATDYKISNEEGFPKIKPNNSDEKIITVKMRWNISFVENAGIKLELKEYQLKAYSPLAKVFMPSDKLKVSDEPLHGMKQKSNKETFSLFNILFDAFIKKMKDFISSFSNKSPRLGTSTKVAEKLNQVPPIENNTDYSLTAYRFGNYP